MNSNYQYLSKLYCALIPIIGVVVILSVPQRLGLSIVSQEVVTTILGFAVAAAFLKHPYGEKNMPLGEQIFRWVKKNSFCWYYVPSGE